MTAAIIIVLFAALFVAVLIAAICLAGSTALAQKHPLLNAAPKGLMFYNFLFAIQVIIKMINPSFASIGFMLGSFVGIGGAVCYYYASTESHKRKLQDREV